MSLSQRIAEVRRQLESASCSAHDNYQRAIDQVERLHGKLDRLQLRAQRRTIREKGRMA
jgi:hypothetical protein